MKQIKITVHKKNGLSLPFFSHLVFLFIMAFTGCYGSLNVTWTQGQIVEEFSPGDTAERSIGFTLSGDTSQKYDIRLDVSSELESIILVDSESFLGVSPGQDCSTKLTISIPSDIVPGTYQGSLQVFTRLQLLSDFMPTSAWSPASPSLSIKFTISSPSGDLSVKNSNKYPTRIAKGPDGNFFITDALAGSVFIYDTNLNLSGELKNLDLPLGIAVDQAGTIFVGNNGRDNVEVYGNNGLLHSVIDSGNILMPNDMTLDQDGNLYVVDSLANTVKVYSALGNLLRSIGGPGDGDGEFKFPVSLTISYTQASGQLYVADQGHGKIQVYDLLGNYLRSFGEKIPAFSSTWEGRFTRLQSLSFDSTGRLHAADCYLNKIQILNSVTGEFINSYGSFGSAAGQLNLPLDIIVINPGLTVVANNGNHKVENLAYTMP